MKINVAKEDLELLKYPDGSPSREWTAIKLKLEGKNLEEIGRIYKVTRETVRQFILKGLAKIEKEKILLSMDKDPDATIKAVLMRIEDVFSGKTCSVLAKVEELEKRRQGKENSWRRKFERVGDLIGLTDQELLKYRGFGKKSLREVREFMGRYSLGSKRVISEMKIK